MTNTSEIELSVSQFVSLLNQTLEYAYPNLVITGELANLRVAKNRWVYFDLKDDEASVKFFGTVYQLPGPLEDGMLLKVRGQPRMHPNFGFSVNVMNIQLSGEGSIKKAHQLLQAKLKAEGLFEASRKRTLPYPPTKIGLITSKESAAYADFIKVLSARWQGVLIELIDVQVQGEPAPAQIVEAIEQFNARATPPDTLVLVRGGGSADDLAAWSTESVTRAVAASRVPTLVAIGHEVDLSLAELAADMRASTPSNAAEILIPDKSEIHKALGLISQELARLSSNIIATQKLKLTDASDHLNQSLSSQFMYANSSLSAGKKLLEALNPETILRRGYAVVRKNGKALKSLKAVKIGDTLKVQLAEGYIGAKVNSIDSQAKPS